MTTRLLVLLGATLLGGAIPLWVRRSHGLLHRFVALTTGLFLGIVFLHLLPEALAPPADGDGLDAPWPGLLVLLGVVLLYVLQNLVLPGRTSTDPHVVVGWGSFLGLSVHALAEGLGLAAVREAGGMTGVLYFSIVAHKLVEGFSLATVFSLGHAPRPRTVLLLAIFSLVTPVGFLLGSGLFAQLSPAGAQVLTALAAGTFLFVALIDLLPEVLHGREDGPARLLLLAVGTLLALGLHHFGG